MKVRDDEFSKDGAWTDLRSVEYRFPIIDTAYPRWRYITAIVVDDRFMSPTDEEVRMVASFHEEYCSRWYRESFRQEMRKLYPFDIDGSANGRFLVKYKHGGWAFRRASWSMGPLFAPTEDKPPLTLEQCLDDESSLGDIPYKPWLAWKLAHPQIFVAQEQTTPGLLSHNLSRQGPQPEAVGPHPGIGRSARNKRTVE